MITRLADHPDLIKLMGQLSVEFCITNEAQRTLLSEGLASIVVKPALPDSGDPDEYLLELTDRGTRMLANPNVTYYG